MNEKIEFLKTYVLNRTKSVTGSLSGEAVAKEALFAWNVIEKESKKMNKKTNSVNIK